MLSLTTRFKIIISVLAVVLLTGSFILYNKTKAPEGKNEVLIKTLMQGISSLHYQPSELNDDFSKKAFSLYLERLDYNKKFLLESDVAALRKFETAIDDQLRAGSFEFFDASAQLINTRIKESEAFYKEILAKPFDFNKDETIELDGKKLAFAKDAAALKEAWRKQLKYQTLVQLSNMQEQQQKAAEKDKKKETKPFEQLEKEARERVTKTYNDLYQHLLKRNDEDWRSIYINAVTNVYDPHTGYFPPKDKANFDIGFTGRLEGIGATLQEKDGQIKVLEIVPGSPSYRQGDLKPGDAIQKVGQGDQEPVVVEGMRLDDAIQLIRGKKGTEVRLTVRKPDGSTRLIPIVRDVIVIEETYAQSAVINGNQKIGYIKLPSFYADFERREDGRNSGEDVKREIEKLKGEGINGLVLDLRNNGGGSLGDAIEMAGLFIERGPVVQVKSSAGKTVAYDDRDPQVQYSGPLVVLVNANSASASEILAAAMQDYKRAVIVGSQTFGKGTVQQFIELDEALPAQFNPYKPLGSLKLTTQKFYRINGGTTQLRGVKPDVELPDAYSFLEFGEKEQDYPLAFDEISPARYSQWPNGKINISQIQANSKKRIASNKSFNLIKESGTRMKQQADNTVRSLNFKKYVEEEKKAEAESKRFDEAQKEVPVLDVYRLKQDLQAAATDTATAAKNKDFLKSLQKDIYVEEAVAIIKNDLK
ncbi:carboxy terminal-processing peptidase [Pontibacter sp. SGAir0037]|uniref:carboxy terminal-processing peptidase n=1 Tax=Pontibacter sp. SGAir0037 TaxID=2571030 RepID=UPI0010CCC9F5|nr:carboxy terminal-processing peptidase [Pontibacter sp. SGAir0037]QCR24615.1 tail-specific protease [Pontibacter sp. SGAir0037]